MPAIEYTKKEMIEHVDWMKRLLAMKTHQLNKGLEDKKLWSFILIQQIPVIEHHIKFYEKILEENRKWAQ